MTLFALCNGPRTPSLMCYDHMGRSTGGSTKLQMILWYMCIHPTTSPQARDLEPPAHTPSTSPSARRIGQWIVQMGIAASFWFTSLGGTVLDQLSITKVGPRSLERGVAIVVMLGCVAAHYYWVFVHRQLSAKITMGLDTSFMVIFLICCIQGGACLLAWCLPLPPAVFAVSIVLFVVGLSIEAISDEQLHAFVSRKTAPGYSGPRVMTTGLRGFSRHPNLIGFVMYWCGFALISGAWYFCLGVVLAFVIFFAVQVIPALEFHMRTKYGQEWEAYVARTPVWIPHPFCRKTEVTME